MVQQVRKCLRCKWLRVYKAASVGTLVNWNPDMYKRLVRELLRLRRLRIDPRSAKDQKWTREGCRHT